MIDKYLQLKYHPATKQVQFTRVQNGEESEILSNSALYPYVRDAGTFILQNQGNQFFEDIASAYDSEDQVSVKLITTKSDYEDFRNMLDYYNKSEERSCTITATLLAELPDMASAYEMVKEFGIESKQVLEAYYEEFSPEQAKDENVKEFCNSIQEKLEAQIENIEEKVDSLRSNNVNLCFAGVYSAGKSTLINAVLGARVLPESIESKTAKMFEISSPQEEDPISISFAMEGVTTEIIWSETKTTLEIIAGPMETEDRKVIQTTINAVKEEPCHVQLQKTLDVINACSTVSEKIQVFYPIPLDKESLAFTIYDTPGSDSNDDAHKETLIEALNTQTHSILIYVIAPTKLEGSGNRALLEHLKGAKENNNQTSIDIDRSLFVVNQSDTIVSTDRETFHTKELKFVNKNSAETEDSDTNQASGIPLEDKKLLFISARDALLARMKEANLINGIDEQLYTYQTKGKYQIKEADMFRTYMQNRCGKSDISTEKMKTSANNALDRAFEEGNEEQVSQIGAGLFSLEQNILEYGEKYALAVKTFAIIDTVEQVLKTTGKEVEASKQDVEQQKKTLDKDISESTKILTKAINDVSKKYEIQDNKLDSDSLRRLGLTAEQLKRDFADPILQKVASHFSGVFFNERILDLGSYTEDKRAVVSICDSDYKKFHSKYQKEAERLLSELQNKLVEDLKEAIRQNGNISEKAKEYLVEFTIPEPKLKNVDMKFDKIVEDTRKKKWSLFHWDTITVDKVDIPTLKKELNKKIKSDQEQITKEFSSHYREALEQIVIKIDTDFKRELNTFSARIMGKLNSKDETELLEAKILAMGKNVMALKEDLETKIWNEVQ